ncbi:hypothetical protein TYRP_016874 [Tyrophagus putrescentiae]|nr:hypothetical protein TYRP_016874 [Tyrophagus putrescentiae]
MLIKLEVLADSEQINDVLQEEADNHLEPGVGPSPVGKLARLELPYSGAKGADSDPEKFLQWARCIALWKRQLFVLLKTPIISFKEFDENGISFAHNCLYICSKVMIIDIDEGHRWLVVDTAKLAINKSCLSMIANKFKWAQCGAEGQQLVGVLTCFDEFFKEKEEDGEDCRIRQKNVVNSVVSLDLETLQWRCLNTGKNEAKISRRANSAAVADIYSSQLKMVTTPSITRMTVAANDDELWILPRSEVDVPLDHLATVEFF